MIVNERRQVWIMQYLLSTEHTKIKEYANKGRGIADIRSYIWLP